MKVPLEGRKVCMEERIRSHNTKTIPSVTRGFSSFWSVLQREMLAVEPGIGCSGLALGVLPQPGTQAQDSQHLVGLGCITVETPLICL